VNLASSRAASPRPRARSARSRWTLSVAPRSMGLSGRAPAAVTPVQRQAVARAALSQPLRLRPPRLRPPRQPRQRQSRRAVAPVLFPAIRHAAALPFARIRRVRAVCSTSAQGLSAWPSATALPPLPPAPRTATAPPARCALVIVTLLIVARYVISPAAVPRRPRAAGRARAGRSAGRRLGGTPASVLPPTTRASFLRRPRAVGRA